MIKTPELNELHAVKYRGNGESHRESCNRVASVLAPGDGFHAFRGILEDLRFMPGGRIQAAIGSTKKVTPYNCYVSGTIADSFVDGHGSIMERAREAAATMRMGGGIGYDFSTLRPRGAMIRKLGSRSSGPLAFMEIFDAVCRATASSGHRRGAQMGVMRVDHPDIEEFVRAKQNEERLRGFNVSVAVTDEFMRALTEGRAFPLRWGGEVYREVDPHQLWETIMRSTWDWAEPGVLFIDEINDQNNLAYCETIAATNPCGEQPLPPYGSCLLGSFNLVRYLRGREFNFAQLRTDVAPVVAAMDRVVDVASYPLHEQSEEAHGKRRMGLGITGLANTLEAMGMSYGDERFVEMQRIILFEIRNAAYAASAKLAAERGSFPSFRRDEYLAAPFVARLPADVRDLIAKHGMRNSHLLSIAPTGTISLCADNVSSGIEPVFAYEADRTLELFEGPRQLRVHDYGKKFLGVEGKPSAEVTVAEHLDVLITAQLYVDSSVSKTLNVPPTTPWEDFKDIYIRAWRGGAKGCTTFQTGGRRAPVIESACPIGGCE